MSSLRQGIRALIDAPGTVTKTALVSLLKQHPAEDEKKLQAPADLIALNSEAVLRSEGGCVYTKEGESGEDGFRESGNAFLHAATDITLPATLLSDGTR